MPKSKFPIDLNCDLGEGLPNDALLMPFLGSCNIACGGHAGDESTILNDLSLAKEFGVKAGAHPSYPDKVNFGRIMMDYPKEMLFSSLLEQVRLFESCAKSIGVQMHHIKPHGALYNHAAKDEATAWLILDLLQRHFPGTILYCPPHSIIGKLAMQENIPVHFEIFADRRYQDDLSLVPRTHPRALLTDPEEVLAQVDLMVSQGLIKTITGKVFSVKADTLCLHGDNPNAYKILIFINKKYDI